MSDNLRIWSQVERTDPAHTKKVNQRGGFTAISAAYQIMRATEVFGPIGVGWGYDSGEPIFQEGLVIIPVTLWHSSDRGTVYGPMFGGAEWKASNGRLDSDALKKATTDALTKLLSQLGFNADVFLGRFDDNKYLAEVKAEFAEDKAQLSKLGSRSDTGPGEVEGRDFWKCEGPGMSAHAAKAAKLDEVHEQMRSELDRIMTAEAWRKWADDNLDDIQKMPLSWRMILRAEAEEHGIELGVFAK